VSTFFSSGRSSGGWITTKWWSNSLLNSLTAIGFVIVAIFVSSSIHPGRSRAENWFGAATCAPHGEHYRKRGNGPAPRTGKRSASALRVHHSKTRGRSGGRSNSGQLSNCHRNFHGVVSHVTGRLIVVRFHTPFWRRVEAQGGNKKPSPRSGRNGQLSRAIADGFPHWLKLQHRTP